MHSSQKTWKGYVIEFVMLFLAVFLGFFADNLRDKSNEKTIEKEYIQSLVEDIKNDKVQIEKTIHNNKIRKSYIDSLSILCFHYHPEKTNKEHLYRYFTIILLRPDFFSPNDLTKAQLKNSGGMRFIRKKKVVKEIWEYDLQEKKLHNQQKYYENYQNNSINLGMKIFNLNPIMHPDTLSVEAKNFQLLTTSEKDIKEFANMISMYGGIVEYYNMILKETSQHADSLINTLKKEYEIK